MEIQLCNIVDKCMRVIEPEVNIIEANHVAQEIRTKEGIDTYVCPLSVSEMATCVRRKVRLAEISAGVSQNHFGGRAHITIHVPRFSVRFTEDEIRRFSQIAKDCGLFSQNGTEIDVDIETRHTENLQWNFQYRGGH